MDKFIYTLDAVDPWDGDSYEVGTFSDPDIAEEARRRYEYTTDTGYIQGVVSCVRVDDYDHELFKDDLFIGYFAFCDDGKFVIVRDKIAYREYDMEMILDDLVGNCYEGHEVSEDKENSILYTVVPYSKIDTEMETEASKKFMNYLHKKNN